MFVGPSVCLPVSVWQSVRLYMFVDQSKPSVNQSVGSSVGLSLLRLLVCLSATL